MCKCYRGGLQALLLQLRLMALGLLMLEQKVRGTIFPSAFLLQPNLVYCFPEKKDNGHFGYHEGTASTVIATVCSPDLLHKVWNSGTISSEPIHKIWHPLSEGWTPVKIEDGSG